MDNDSLSPLLKPLTDLPGVAGVALFDRERTLVDTLPARDSAELRRVVLELLAGYSKVGRVPAQLLFGFNGSALLVMSASNHHLAVVVRDPARLDAAAQAGSAVSVSIEPRWAGLQADNGSRRAARVKLLRWQDCEPALRQILSKVLASAQAERLITREFADRKIQRDQATDLPQLRLFAAALLEHIPLKSRRELIRAEIEHYLATLQP